jgi:hypothetical protein
MNVHRHRWHEVRRSSFPGALQQGTSFEFKGGLLGDAGRAAIFGRTVIEERCDRCRTTRLRQFPCAHAGVSAPSEGDAA